jgi:predicted transcriptional regulator YheO
MVNMLLEDLAPLAEAISKLLHPMAEVVVHDLEANRIAHISNSFSGRKVGDPSFLEDLEGLDRGPDVYGPFDKQGAGGQRLRYVAAIARGEAGKPRGLLCINLDVTGFVAVGQTLESFLGGAKDSTALDELFDDDWQSRITSFVDRYLKERQRSLKGLTKSERGELVRSLHDAGAFRVKHAARFTANVLGVSRATIYNDLGPGRESAGGADQ